jgi:energy-coupling factor transporter ATP-binding protein EcfA2
LINEEQYDLLFFLINLLKMKQHSKDYLIEFANLDKTFNWMRLLIHKTIMTNGNILSKDMDLIYEMLKGDNTSEVPAIGCEDEKRKDVSVLLKNLIYHKGVGALKEEQNISFSKEITILYGLNGSGKSSYFKILNEVVGGNQQKEIKCNIYRDQAVPIDVDIKYLENEKNEKSIKWDNSSRSIPPLNCIRVFDSSYLNGLLSKRNTDETIITPYGLHLFSYISSKLDELKQRIEEEILTEYSQQPNIDTTILSENYKVMISTKKTSNRLKHEIEKLYVFSNELQNVLNSKNEKIKDLEQNNLKDKIEIEEIRRDKLLQLEQTIIAHNKWINENLSDVKDLIYSYYYYENESNISKKRLSILNEIGNTDSESWKAFIKAGDSYTKGTHLEELVCPYCRQPLAESAINIIKAYGLFINDDTEKYLSAIDTQIFRKKQGIENYDISLSIDEKIKKTLGSKECANSNLLVIIQSLQQQYKSIKYMLSFFLENRSINNDIYLNEGTVGNELSSYISEIRKNIELYKIDGNEKEKTIGTLKSEIRPLLEHKFISENKGAFEKWFLHYLQVEKLLSAKRNITTRGISELASRVYTELVTENLKQKFEEELKAIGLDNLNITLENVGAKKGSSSMKMKLEKSDDITSILSEGEQKGVGLALFLAEVQMQRIPNPIILDDPVNSLDHKIAAFFANRLISLGNQIILFTHNKLFLDAFECSAEAHICKNGNGGCNATKGKHVILYDILSEGKMAKGVIAFKQANTSKSFIDGAKRMLQKTPFIENLEVSSKLRYAIERIIDEVVFNCQIPTRLSNKNSRINWTDLKELNNDSVLIDKLHAYHSRLSGGCLHNGEEECENPIEKEEYETIISYLESIKMSKI